MDEIYDLAIIGGGINGCGIARDAVGRGLKVYLCEMNDLASGTSSRSTKLIHGGLRYLEYYQFGLVREALIEREVLWALAPHVIRPLRFVLPHHRGLRPAWVLRLGLFLYDHLGGRRLLPPAKTLNLERDKAGWPLKSDAFVHGFEYSDCWVDDARLVILNARDAADRGAKIETYTAAISAHRDGNNWQLNVETKSAGTRRRIRAKVLINAAGPWVSNVLSNCIGAHAKTKVRLVQGSHIVVRKLYDHDRCYIFQNRDGRIVFIIPYETNFTLIGTTDRDYQDDPANAQATTDEVAYLCATVSEYFRIPVQPADVVWTYSGVRPLYDDGTPDAQAATREYVLDVDAPPDQPPLLSVFGGKITTYRRLAEAALDRLVAYLPDLKRNVGWTARSPLPGGDITLTDDRSYTARLRLSFPFISANHARRLVNAYGTRAQRVLGDARRFEDLGLLFGADLTEAEVRYLMTEEWANTAEDVLWRRSKLGLALSPAQAAALDRYMTSASSTEGNQLLRAGW